MSPAGIDFLVRITADRRRRVETMMGQVPPHVLRERITVRPAGRLEYALRRGGAERPLRMLCEVKRASPSLGELRADADPTAMAQIYERGGAAAVSLVTEPDHFMGEPEWVDAVRPHVSIPILMKDFVVDSYQLLDAASRGADGVLLLAALLSATQIQRFVIEAKLLGLDALVEVHDQNELARALKAGATLVGVNNRDLHSFEVNLDTSIKLMPRIPSHVTAVAESGLSRPEDLARLRATRCDAVLMGEVFMTSADPAATLATLSAAASG